MKIHVIVKLVAYQNDDIKFEVKPWPIHVPAAAVIHEWRALSVIIGRIGYVGCERSYALLKWLTGPFITPFY